MNASKSVSLLNSTLQLTAVSLFSQFLYFFYQVMLSRVVGTEVLGLIHMVMPIYYTVLSFFTSGFSLAVSKLSSEYQSTNNQIALGQIVERTMKLFLPPFLIFGALFFFVYQTLSEHYFSQPPHILFLLTIPLLLFFTAKELFNKHYFYGTNCIGIPAAIQITEQLVRMCFVIALLLLIPQKTPMESVLLILVGMLVSEVYSAFHLTYLRKQQPLSITFSPKFKADNRHMNHIILRIALPISLTSFFCQSISTLNAVMIPHLLVQFGFNQTNALQQYGILFGMTIPLLLIPFSLIDALSIVLLPHLSRCRVQNQRQEILKTLQRTVCSITFLLAPVTLLIAHFGTQLGGIFYHNEDVGNFILPLAIGVIISAFEVVAETALNAFNKQTANACITLFCTLIQISFTLSGIPVIGLKAFVNGFLVSSGLGCLIRFLLLWRLLSSYPMEKY